MPTLATLQKRALKEAEKSLIQKARQYGHLFISAGILAERSQEWTPISNYQEEEKLEELIKAVEWFDQIVTI